MIANLIFVRDCKVKYVRFENIRVVEEFGYFGNALYFENFSFGFYKFFGIFGRFEDLRGLTDLPISEIFEV